VSYLLGYWGTFNINIFSYLTTSDIIVLSVVPLFSIGITSLIAIIIGDSISPKVLPVITDKKHSSRALLILVSLCVLLISYYIFVLFYLKNLAQSWLILPTLSVVGIILYLRISPRLEKQQEYLKKYYFLIFLFLSLPFQAYGYGKYTAINIQLGKSYKYVVNNLNEIEKEKEQHLIYLGKAGSYIFLYKKLKKQIVVANSSKLPILVLESKNEFRF